MATPVLHQRFDVQCHWGGELALVHPAGDGGHRDVDPQLAPALRLHCADVIDVARPQAVTSRGDRAEAAGQVADALDCIIQPRFQKDDVGFGISRIMTINGHERVAQFTPRDEHEKRLTERLRREQHGPLGSAIRVADRRAQPQGA